MRDAAQKFEAVAFLLQGIAGIRRAQHRDLIGPELHPLAPGGRRHEASPHGKGRTGRDLLVQAFPAGQIVLGDNLKTLQAGTVVQLQEGKARGIAAGPEPAGNPEILFLGG